VLALALRRIQNEVDHPAGDPRATTAGSDLPPTKLPRTKALIEEDIVAQWPVAGLDVDELNLPGLEPVPFQQFIPSCTAAAKSVLRH